MRMLRRPDRVETTLLQRTRKRAGVHGVVGEKHCCAEFHRRPSPFGLRHRSAFQRMSGEGTCQAASGADSARSVPVVDAVRQAPVPALSHGRHVRSERCSPLRRSCREQAWQADVEATGDCEAAPNGRRSHSDAVCPGIFAIEHNWAVEFVPDASCVAIGMAATQPVWLNKARMANVRRGVMAEGPLRRRLLHRGDFPRRSAGYRKASRPTDFRKDRGRIGSVNPQRLAKG